MCGKKNCEETKSLQYNILKEQIKFLSNELCKKEQELLRKERQIEQERAEKARYKNQYDNEINSKLYKLLIPRLRRIVATLRKVKRPIQQKQVSQDSKETSLTCGTEKSLSELNVLLIADEFTYNNIASLFNNVILPTPDNYKEILAMQDIDLFFCESAWLGDSQAWKDMIARGGFRDNTILKKLVVECKKKGIPAIFWNKEDPFHFNDFLDSAKAFDFVYTTCGDAVKKYQQAGCQQVYWAPFFFTPKRFNPIQEMSRQEKAVFAGAYYPTRFPERKQFIHLLPLLFSPKELVIYDRNYKNTHNINQFPEYFKPYIVGNLPASKITEAYKGYKIVLNANSITNSDTMFARRVIEALACNTPVISSKADSIKHFFGNIIVSSNNQEEIQKELNRLFQDHNYYREKCLNGVREVFNKYTNAKVVGDMISNTSINLVKEQNSVAVVSYCKNREESQKVIESFSCQNCEAFYALHIFIPSGEKYEKNLNTYNNGDIYIHPVEYIDVIDDISDLIETEYIAAMSPQEVYGEYYVQDFLHGYQYVDKDIILTQNMGDEYTWVSSVNLARCMVVKKYTPSEVLQALLQGEKCTVPLEKAIFNINNH